MKFLVYANNAMTRPRIKPRPLVLKPNKLTKFQEDFKKHLKASLELFFDIYQDAATGQHHMFEN